MKRLNMNAGDFAALEAAHEERALARRDREQMAREPRDDAPCDFCRNRPVGNAARWTGGSSTQPACPRCGKRFDAEGRQL